MDVKVKQRKGVFEVYAGGELCESFYLEEEARLYAEVLKANLNWEKVKMLVRGSVEENFGGCEILSLRVEFPYICYEICVKGKELFGELDIKEGIFESEERIAEVVISDLARFLDVPLSMSLSAREEKKAGKGREMVGSLF